ncbi:MAG: signal peptide peptidase SppA [Verrucomicrobia bacterium]|nr:signal peptide peptidase SppA [Verrucomicrobiota bacterium]
MKQFFKMMMATVFGLLITIFLVTVGMFAILAVFIGMIASSAEQSPVTIKDKTWLHMDFKEVIVDRGNKDPFANFDFNSFTAVPHLGLNDILKNLENAAKDDRIVGVYLDMSQVNAGFASLNEIREALKRFKESGKPVHAYADNMGQKAFFMASVSDKVCLNPVGLLELQGLSSQHMFYKGALDKLEVEVQVIRHGKFKGAVEPFMLNEMSPENKLQTQKYVRVLWDKMVAGLAEGRGLSVGKINEIADGLKVRSAEDAKELGLVDELCYRDEFIDKLKELGDVAESDKLTRIRISKYARASGNTLAGKNNKDKIAVVYASGGIGMGKSKYGMMGAKTISAAIAKARKNKKVKIIVLRVNSPGGSALASDIIWREIELAKKEKQVVVSMGNLAASGGYYIACGANRILADESTITGSIGVFGLLPNVKGLLNNKLGITTEILNTNSYSDVGSGYRPMTEFERVAIQATVERIYEDFIGKVAKGRGMTVEQVDEIGQGRVWAGKDALAIGLVDELGGLEKAIEVAATMAELKDFSIIEYPTQKDSFEALLESWSENMSEASLKSFFGKDYAHYRNLRDTMNHKGIFARLPYDKLLE